MEITARSPEGILDMMGPRTLDGGYSPSQVISSAMKRAVGWASTLGTKVLWVRVAFWAAGANAVVIATMAARRMRLSLAILYIFNRSGKQG
jgi:hypothetical protein